MVRVGKFLFTVFNLTLPSVRILLTLPDRVKDWAEVLLTGNIDTNMKISILVVFIIASARRVYMRNTIYQ